MKVFVLSLPCSLYLCVWVCQFVAYSVINRSDLPPPLSLEIPAAVFILCLCRFWWSCMHKHVAAVSASCDDKRQWGFKFVTTFCCPGNILFCPALSRPAALESLTALLGRVVSMSFGCHQTKSHMKFAMWLECDQTRVWELGSLPSSTTNRSQDNVTNQDWWAQLKQLEKTILSRSCN